MEDMDSDMAHVTALSDRLIDGITARVPNVMMNGDRERGYPGIVNISFEYVEGESLLMGLKDLAISSGSACPSASLEPSYVLRALGLEKGDGAVETPVQIHGLHLGLIETRKCLQVV